MLKILNLSYNQIADTGVALISRLTNLEELYLNKCWEIKIGPAGASELGRLEKLRVLGLSKS